MSAMTTVISAWPNHGSAMETCAIISLVTVVSLYEAKRRFANTAVEPGGPPQGMGYSKSCKQILSVCAPEVVGVFVCFATAAVFTSCYVPSGEELEAQIMAEWPILTTADTLLALQSMFRVVVLLSATLRGDNSGLVPVSDETSALLWFGGLARVMVIFRSANYAIDGPLGGSLPAACDMVSCILAFALARNTLRRSSFVSVLTITGVAYLSARHCMRMADEHEDADMLYVAAQCFDCLAAFAYLARGLFINSAQSWTNLVQTALMALQALLGAYFFTHALPQDQTIVRYGSPLQLIQLCHLAAGGAYLGYAATLLNEISLDDVELPTWSAPHEQDAAVQRAAIIL